MLGECQLLLSCLLEVLEPEASSGGVSSWRKGNGKHVLLTPPGAPPCQHSPLISFPLSVVNCRQLGDSSVPGVGSGWNQHASPDGNGLKAEKGLRLCHFFPIENVM